MQDSQAFQNALATGKVVVRRWWVNQNSDKNQVSVQFIQQITNPTAELANKKLAITQGIDNPGAQKVTAIESFAAPVAVKLLGSTEGDIHLEERQQLFANELFGEVVNIQVTENFQQNPYRQNQEPKVNPNTGEIVVGYNPATQQNEPVYRHTDVVMGTPVHTFIQSTSINAPAPASQSLGSLESLAEK